MKVTSHDFELTLEHRTAYLYVRIAAQRVTAEMLRHLLSIAAPHYRDRRVASVMIERDIPAPLTSENASHIIHTMAETMPAGLSIAYVEREELNREMLKNAVASVSPESIEIDVFAAPDEAETWLTSLCSRAS